MSPEDVLSKFPGLLSLLFFPFFSVDLFTMKIFYVIFVDGNRRINNGDLVNENS